MMPWTSVYSMVQHICHLVHANTMLMRVSGSWYCSHEQMRELRPPKVGNLGDPWHDFLFFYLFKKSCFIVSCLKPFHRKAVLGYVTDVSEKGFNSGHSFGLWNICA